MTARRISGHPRVSTPINFSFDGRSYVGRAGDTIASALLANDVAVIGRSFKYHRPRGIYGAWTEEPNAIVDVTLDGRTTPNVRATTETLVEGMAVRAGNASPTAEGDRHGFLDRFARFIPAGFYYKTFMWPDWHAFEPRIRQMAGLGRLDPTHEPPADSPQINARCDVLVIGGGLTGLTAARAAARSGKRVMLVDDRSTLWGERHPLAAIDGNGPYIWVISVIKELNDAGHRLLSLATAYGLYQHNLVCIWQRCPGGADKLWRIRADEIILATGAIERPLVFPDNDRPGVMSAEAALTYLANFGVLVGERIVIATNNDSAYAVAMRLKHQATEVTIADTRAAGPEAPDGVDVRRGVGISRVHGTNRVEGVTIGSEYVAADCLLMSGGFSPTVHLYAQAGGKLKFDEKTLALVPRDKIAGLTVVGAANGTFDPTAALAEAHAAGGGTGDPPVYLSPTTTTYAIEPAWPKLGSKGRQWIDFQNDVTVKDIELAARENFRSVEHLKRYTTLGMATDQGKTSNLNGLATMAAITGRTIGETGTTTYRPPFVPVPLKVIAGRRRGELFNPVRRLILEPAHRAANAVFREYGGWLRPAYYGSGEAQAEISREAKIARETVAILDGSPLGKIEVFGPQAGALVDYNSYNTISSLKPGRIRYGFMLTESGIVYDDGVVAKVADTHYIVSCSSGHVDGVAMRLEEWRQDRFDSAEVVVHNSTPQWATLTATGPRSRDLVAGLGLGVDLDDAALPHMAFVTGTFAGHMARVARVSFTGDRSYEISVPSLVAPDLFQAIQRLLSQFDGCLLGSEALLVLRAEKGYLIVGKDTDGTTMPHDLGVSGPRDKRRDEYVGKRSLFTDNAARNDRAQIVGLTVVGRDPLPTGAHGIETSNGKRRSIGFVTSSYASAALGQPIALGLIERGLSRMGEEIELVHLGQTFKAAISAPCAFDIEGRRLNA